MPKVSTQVYMMAMRFELATQKCRFCCVFPTQSHYIYDIITEQEGIVMLLVSFCG